MPTYSWLWPSRLGCGRQSRARGWKRAVSMEEGPPCRTGFHEERQGVRPPGGDVPACQAVACAHQDARGSGRSIKVAGAVARNRPQPTSPRLSSLAAAGPRPTLFLLGRHFGAMAKRLASGQPTITTAASPSQRSLKSSAAEASPPGCAAVLPARARRGRRLPRGAGWTAPVEVPLLEAEPRAAASRPAASAVRLLAALACLLLAPGGMGAVPAAAAVVAAAVLSPGWDARLLPGSWLGAGQAPSCSAFTCSSGKPRCGSWPGDGGS